MSEENTNILIENLCMSDYIKVTKEISSLEEEIDRLNNCYCNRSDCAGRLNQKNEVYDSLQQRIEKAIEYIETHELNFKKGTTTFGSERLSMEERKLIDILRGEDKE